MNNKTDVKSIEEQVEEFKQEFKHTWNYKLAEPELISWLTKALEERDRIAREGLLTKGEVADLLKEAEARGREDCEKRTGTYPPQLPPPNRHSRRP